MPINPNIRVEEITSVQQLLEQIDFLKAQSNFERIWFRGVADESYGLEPSLFRQNIQVSIEKDLYNKFRTRAIRYLSSRKDSYPEWLLIMQHHGVPTRLLDWSEAALIGLSFSVLFREEKHLSKDAALWCLNPLKLNKEFVKGFKPSEILPSIDDETVPTLKTYFDPEIPKEYPIAVYGPQNNERIVAQKGVFTLFPFSERFKMEELPESHNFLAKLIIRKENIATIKEQLITLGITETLVYPGLDYLAKELKREVFNQ